MFRNIYIITEIPLSDDLAGYQLRVQSTNRDALLLTQEIPLIMEQLVNNHEPNLDNLANLGNCRFTIREAGLVHLFNSSSLSEVIEMLKDLIHDERLLAENSMNGGYHNWRFRN